MIIIGAKLIKNHKTIKRVTFTMQGEYKSEDFYFYMTQLCQMLDISSPIIIPYHRECYENFNSLKLNPDDFFDTVNFDYMFIENDDR